MKAKSAFCMLLCAIASSAVAQTQPSGTQAYPDRPIRVVVPFRVGGSLDIAARLVAQKLALALSQTVVVENREGAGGNVGATFVTKSAPDGYTLLHTLNAIALAPALYRDLAFDPIRDLAPVIQVTAQAMVMTVDPSLSPKSVKEFIEYANARPGAVFFGSAGVGSFDHLAGELLKSMTGVKITHVPYKDGTIAKNDVMGGRVSLIFIGMADVPMVKAGKLKGLAVTSLQRSKAIPELPTMAESGIAQYEVVNANALFAPAATPKPTIALLNAEVNKILTLPDVRATFDKLTVEAIGGSPEGLESRLRADTAKWKKVVEEANIRME